MRLDMPTIMFVATTPFAVNSFLANHIAALSQSWRVILCTNLDAYELMPSLLNTIVVHHIPFARKISIGLDLKSLLQLATLVRQLKPIAIHSITPKAGLLAMLAGSIAGVPNRLHTFTGQVWITKQGCVRRALKVFDRLIALQATHIFADSASQCRLLRDEGVVRHGQIRMLGPGSIAGVDLKRFCTDIINREQIRERVGTNEYACVFLFVGRLTKDKGVFDLIKAFRELTAVERNVELWMVGPDEEGLSLELRKSAEGCGAPIRWLGATSTPEHFMAAADVLVLPSYREGFGSAIIEAAACGIPTIAYRIDGVIDAVIDEITGCLLPKGDVMAFAQAMQRLACDQKALRNLSQAAQKRAIEHFSSSSVTAAWLAFYKSELKKSVAERDRYNLSRYEMTIKLKRTFDVVMVLLALPFLIPFLLFISALVRLTSPGPALYWSNRVGRGNQIFKMPKFRSMHVNTPVMATNLLQDPKQWLTPIGSFLRRTSLDELPQLWNILKGDMSFVGPRPALFNESDLIALRTDAGIHELIPGLTGWAQVNGRDELSIPDKVKLDAEYLEKRSLGFDLRILWLTLFKVLCRDGVSH